MQIKLFNQHLNNSPARKRQYCSITFLLTSFVVLLSLALGLFQSYSASAQNERLSFGEGQGIQMIDPDGLNTIPFWHYNNRAVDFSLYTLPTDHFLSNYTRLHPHSSNQTWDTASLTLQQSWTVTDTRDLPPYSDEMWPVALPEGTESGIYIIKATDAGESASSMIVVGRTTLMLKKGNNGQVVVWATTLQSGAPVAGMEITLYNMGSGQQQIAQGTTDEMGVVELNSGEATNVMAIGQTEAEGDREVALAGTDNQWRNRNVSYWWQAQTQEDYRIYLYTDRPIYRPGHTIYFDTLIRNNIQDGYSVIDASTPMTATLRDPRNTIVDTVALEADEFGISCWRSMVSLRNSPSRLKSIANLNMRSRSLQKTALPLWVTPLQ